MRALGAFAWHDGAIERRFTGAERRMLENLAANLRSTLDERDPSDPVVRRLVPDPYPDDAEAAAEFADATRDRVADSKSDAAAGIAADLAAAPNGRVRLDPQRAELWLRGLGSLRLALTERVGFAEVQRSVRTPHGLTYAWLTWLQGSLVDAVVGD